MLSCFSPSQTYATWLPSGENVGDSAVPGMVVNGKMVGRGISNRMRERNIHAPAKASGMATAAAIHAHAFFLAGAGPAAANWPESNSSFNSTSATFTSSLCLETAYQIFPQTPGDDLFQVARHGFGRNARDWLWLIAQN